jgi:hypothetical protein
MPNFSSLTGRLLDQELHSEDSTVLFTTAKRNAAVNEGVREFAKLTSCYQRRSSITVTGGTGEYNLLSTTILPGGDFLGWVQIGPEFRYTDASSNTQVLAGNEDFPQRSVEWLDSFSPGWQISTQASSIAQLPQCWYERIESGRRLLGFFPVPSTGSSATAEVFITYRAKPQPMSSTGAIPFTDTNGIVRTDLEDYHKAAVHYAASELEKLRPDDQASQTQLQKFLGYVAQYLQDHRKRGGTHVTPMRSYFRRGGSALGEDPRT